MSAKNNSENEADTEGREEENWVINGWKLDEKCHCLIQGEDVVRLEPKITQLMAYLAARAGEPISPMRSTKSAGRSATAARTRRSSRPSRRWAIGW
jgi:DNA-binding response OmpR family regulator